jgi:hypothetical protein
LRIAATVQRARGALPLPRKAFVLPRCGYVLGLDPAKGLKLFKHGIETKLIY